VDAIAQKMMKLIYILNRSHLFVSICAAFLAAETFLISGNKIYFLPIAAAFFLTWCAYLVIHPPQKAKVRKVLQYTAATGSVICTAYFKLELLPFFIFALLLVVFYKSDLLSQAGIKNSFQIRKYGVIKTICTALGWTIVTSIFSASFANKNFESHTLMIYSNFFWVAFMAIAADIRDSNIDELAIQTIPRKFGNRIALLICTAFIVFAVFLLGEATRPNDPAFFPAVTIMLAALFISIVPAKRINWNLRTFLLDGMIVMRCLVFVFIDLV
jgi:4-hydroxybenzoate polyprenyltransferase